MENSHQGAPDNPDKERFAAQFVPPPSQDAADKVPPLPNPSTDPTNTPTKLPSAFSLFTPSSKFVQRNLSNFLIIYFIPAAVIAVVDLFVTPSTDHRISNAWLSIFLIVALYYLIILAAKPFLELAAAKGHKPSLYKVFEQSSLYWIRLLGLYIVQGFAIVFGFILLIIPGLILITRFYFAQYFLIEENLGVFDAMRRSNAITKGHAMAVWGVIGVQFLLGTGGWIPFIGPLISAGLGMLYDCAPAIRFMELKALADRSTPGVKA
jgi:hypothetical protein